MNKGESILIIDDMFDNIIAFTALIKEFFKNTKIYSASNGIDGIELIKKNQPNVVLLDLFMPNMDGFEVVEKLKQDEDTKNIPIIVITASKEEKELKIKALSLGAEAFLSKPVDAPEFVAQVRSMIKISEANIQKITENERLNVLVENRTTELKKALKEIKELNSVLEGENIARRKNEKALLEAQRMAKISSFEYGYIDGQIHWTREALNLFETDNLEDINSIEKVDIFLIEGQKVVGEIIDKEVSNRSTSRKIIHTVRLYNNIKKHFEIRIEVQYKADGNHTISGTVQDITAQIDAEERLEYISQHDYLTGLYNRRYFENMVQQYDHPDYYPLSLIMADVNGLKMVNDSFGHNKGDDVLKWAANILQSRIKKNDVVARYGGDEFVILLPRRDENEVEEMIRQMKEEVYSNKDIPFSLSISFGYQTKNSQYVSMQVIFKKAEEFMYRHKITESGSMRSKSVDLILNALFAKSPREMNHSRRVSEICEAIAKALQMNEDEVNQMRLAGLLHDIGKIGIDENILNKNGKLSLEEYEEVKKHSEIGYRILSSVSEFSELSRFVLEHQEKLDGSGYPNGLKGNQISKQAKIIAIADAFDAMTSDRTYRKGLTKMEAVNEIIKYTNIQFDQEIVKVFFEKVLYYDIKNINEKSILS